MTVELKFPELATYRLADARVPSCLLPAGLAGAGNGAGDGAAVDIDIRQGQITAVSSAGQSGTDLPIVDLQGRQVWPCFVDLHTHLDKGHTSRRAPNIDGTFGSAVKAIAADRANWTRADLKRRMEFGLTASYAHGTRALRTHLDSVGAHTAQSWQVFAELQREWSGRIELQAACLASIEFYRDAAAAATLADLVARHGGTLGGIAFMTPDLDALLDRVIALAAERGLNLDFHADETGDPGSQSLAHIAAALRRNRFKGKVVCGHCCSLATQPSELAAAAMDALTELGVAVVSLPMCNLFLQDRTYSAAAAPVTPRWRGVTLLHELRARGVSVCLASDNVRDAFYPYGDHDMLEVFAAGAKIAHLDRPFGDWPRAVTATPAAAMGLRDLGLIAPGERADLVIFTARDIETLLCRPQSDRTVLRDGRRIDTTLPAHLDA